MYGKIFEQIFDSSIAEDYRVRLVFQDMIVLADMHGVVDRTHEAIARRTNVPEKIVRQAITVLESPDKNSRSPEHGGARIVRLDEHRDWGWVIVNHQKFRQIASEDQRREKTRERVDRFRTKHKESKPTEPKDKEHNDLEQCNAPVTPCNAGNAMQRQKQRHSTENNQPTREGPPKIEDVKARAEFVGCSAEEAERFWNHFESSGWIDKHGNPIVNWVAKLATWTVGNRAKPLETKQKTNGENGTKSDYWRNKSEYDLINEELKAIRERASHTAMGITIETKDRASYAKLKERRKELRAALHLKE